MGIFKAFHKRRDLKIAPGNSMLSNSAYRGYKSRESLARSYHVFAASQTSFLVTAAKVVEFLADKHVHKESFSDLARVRSIKII